MLESITLKFTETPDLILPTTGITIFVGPNNSGKSLVLKEVEQAFITHPFPGGLHILKDYEVKWPSPQELNKSLAGFSSFQHAGQPVDNITLGRLNPNGGVETTTLLKSTIQIISNEKRDKRWWATQFLRWGVLRLDGRSRFNLTNDQTAGDLLSTPQNVLAHLFQDDAARNKVRAFIKDAFGLDFVIDPTNLGKLRIRLSNQPPLADEQSLSEQARAYYKRAIHIKDASDGVQAFTGITTAVMSGEFHTILIDEPEAFLHPPLARKLGKHLGSLAAERGGCLLASTHSPDFLMGCVQATKDVRIVRLEYSEGKSRGRMVDPMQLEAVFRSPLMRSTNAIAGLFYDGVVVTESDNDRAFYSEIYHRISSTQEDAPSLLFINAQNKQTIKNVIEPLRKFGVPAAAIPDIDIVKDGGKTWTEWLQAAHIPDVLHAGYQAQRSSIKLCLEKTGKDMKAGGGVDILATAEKSAANLLFDTLEQYGIFVVRRGELENWLPVLGISGKKTDWTIATLERLGSDPSSQSYVRAGTDDVWQFMSGIMSWIKDRTRKGTD
ncbi:MAG TPA: AAA family ATPase [Burkholderiaceae bacterium]|nr:AAA family ATPase [Burkholderiaceae bacterium]